MIDEKNTEKATQKGVAFSMFGTPDAIRTHDLQSRSLTLYPAELQALIYDCFIVHHFQKIVKSFSKKLQKVLTLFSECTIIKFVCESWTMC